MSDHVTAIDMAPVTGSIGTYGDEADRQKNLLHNKGKLSAAEVDKVVRELNDNMRLFETKISFAVDSVTHKVVIKVMDAGTEEIIRQIPPEEMQRVAARITELLGVIFDATA